MKTRLIRKSDGASLTVIDNELVLQNKRLSVHVLLGSGKLFVNYHDTVQLNTISIESYAKTRNDSYGKANRQPITWTLDTSSQYCRKGIAIECRQQILESNAQLYWHIHADERCVISKVGISGLNDKLLRFINFQGDVCKDFSHPMKMLHLAYCGAHTNSPLSKSYISNISKDGVERSWWATAISFKNYHLFWGYVSALRFVGKAELDNGILTMMNYTEGVPADTEGITWSEPLYMAVGPDLGCILENYADSSAHYLGVSIQRPSNYGWGSWLQYQDAITDDLVMANSDAMSLVAAAVPKIKAVCQIDHGWEERISLHRPESSWLARHEFSDDFSMLIQHIQKLNLRPGLWVVPFVVNKGSRYIQDHQEYLVRDSAGDPKRIGGGGFGYCIDPTHPKGEAWLRSLFRRLTAEGIDYFKLDYLRALLAPEPLDEHDGLDQPRLYWNGMNRVEAYRYGLQVIRDAVGASTYLLACGAPLLPSAGLIDGQRIGQDIASSWSNGATGIRDCSRNAACNYFWHGKLWHNDNDYLAIPDEENLQRFWFTTVAMSAGSNIVSTDFQKLSKELRARIAALVPPWIHSGKPSNIGTSEYPAQWHLRIDSTEETYFIVGLFNWEENSGEFSVEIRNLAWDTVPDGCLAWEFWSQTRIYSDNMLLNITIPARDARLLCIRELREHPQLLGTSMHFSMGALEFKRIIWSDDDMSMALELSDEVRKAGSIFIHLPDGYTLSKSDVYYEMKDRNTIALDVTSSPPSVIRAEFINEVSL